MVDLDYDMEPGRGWIVHQPILLDIQDTGYRIQDTGYRIQDTGYRIQDTGYRIQDTGYRIHKYRIKNVWCCRIQDSIF